MGVVDIYSLETGMREDVRNENKKNEEKSTLLRFMALVLTYPIDSVQRVLDSRW